MSIYFQEDEFEEWHELVVKQRDEYKNFIEQIVVGVPTIAGMASPYRSLTISEIKKMAKDLLQ